MFEPKDRSEQFWMHGDAEQYHLEQYDRFRKGSWIYRPLAIIHHELALRHSLKALKLKNEFRAESLETNY